MHPPGQVAALEGDVLPGVEPGVAELADEPVDQRPEELTVQAAGADVDLGVVLLRSGRLVGPVAAGDLGVSL